MTTDINQVSFVVDGFGKSTNLVIHFNDNGFDIRSCQQLIGSGETSGTGTQDNSFSHIPTGYALCQKKSALSSSASSGFILPPRIKRNCRRRSAPSYNFISSAVSGWTPGTGMASIHIQ